MRRGTALLLSWMMYAQGVLWAAPPSAFRPPSAPASSWHLPSAVPPLNEWALRSALAAVQAPAPPTEGARFESSGDEKATPAAPPAQLCTSPVRPILECVRSNGGGSYTAFFGYLSENPAAVAIPIGTKNKFTPTPQGRGQPTTFQPGRTPAYPNTAFSVGFGGANLSWFLKGPDNTGQTVTASSSSPSCVDPCTSSIFGPRRYTRTTGPPNVFTETIAVPPGTPSPYTLRVLNGEPGGQNRISSATITVNGTQVLAPSDLNQNVYLLERAVTLTPTTTLRVELASTPAGYLTINLCGSAAADVTPPQVTWTAPPAVTSDPTPALNVTYQDVAPPGQPPASGVNPTTFKLFVDGVERPGYMTPAAGQATGTIPDAAPLPDGVHQLRAQVKDNAGNQGEAVTSVRVDTTPPVIQVAAPPSGATVGTPTPPVRVTYADTGALDTATLQVHVDGVDKTALFTAGPTEATATLDAPLADGPHEIAASIRDTVGNQGDTTSPFRVDTTAPQVFILSPTEGDSIPGADIPVSGGVVDASPVTVTVNGVPASVEPDGDWSATIPAGGGPSLPIVVEATDSAGNTGQATVTVLVDRTSPVVTITFPAEGATLRGPVNVAGTVSDEGPVQVDVNGQPATVTGSSFTAQVTAPDGPLTLTATARDQANNTGTATRNVTVDSTPPVITVATPLPGLLTNATTLQVSGQVQDASSGTISLGGQSVPFPPGGGPFSFQVALPGDGPVLFSLSATDVADNTGTAEVAVIVDHTPPDLQIASPGVGAVIIAQPVAVQGTVQDASPVTVTVDGAPATVTGLSWLASFDGLPEGPHTFTVVAVDAAGNATTRTRDVTLDLGAPVVEITSPADGSLTRQASVTVTGTVAENTTPTVAVNGVPALVQPAGAGQWTFTAAGVPLNEGDNTLVAVATDAGGRTGEDSVGVTRDSTPPVVALGAPESISRSRPGQATATATDNIGVAQVVMTAVRDTCAAGGGTFTSPPYAIPLTVPECAAPGDTLTVTAQATDLAGNVGQASRGVRVVGEGVVVGQVLSDATSLPLGGATVERLGGETPAFDATDHHGKYSLPAQDATMLLRAGKDGFVSVERSVALAVTGGTVPVDARLTPLAAALSVGSSGGAVNVHVPPATPPEGVESAAVNAVVPRAFRVSVSLPAGAVAGDTPVHLTPLSPQGLPGLLPLGWSPVAAFDLRAGGGTLTCPGGCVAGVTFPSPAPAGMVHLARYHTTMHAWVLVTPSVTATDGTFGLSLPAPGSYALVVPDLVDPPLALPAEGETFPGQPLVSLPLSARSTGSVDPAVLPPTGGTARGTLNVATPLSVPSGTVVQAEVTETFTLSSGQIASQETRLQDILIFRQPLLDGVAETSPPPPVPPLFAALPITPARTFQGTQLQQGRVHLDILAGREGVRGAVGGSDAVTLDAGNARLSVAGGSLSQNTALALIEQPLSSFLPSGNGLIPLEEVFLDFAGRTLGLSAELSVDGSSLEPGDTFVLAQVERLDGMPKLLVVALAGVVAGRLISQPYAGLRGVRKEGRYVFYRLGAPIGFVTGVTTAGGGPVPGVVTTEALPFIGLGGGDGRYIVAAAPGPVGLTATVPQTSLQGSATATVVALETSTADVALTGSVTTATVTPADGSVGVETTIQVQIESPAAISAGTVTTGNVRLLKLPEGGGAPVPVVVRLVLSASGRRLSVVPEPRLLPTTQYRLEVAGLADVVGGLVTVPVVTFTTRSDAPPVYDVDALIFTFPDADGLVTVSAPAGTFPPGTEILIINEGNGVVLSLVAENDGAVGVLVPATFPASLNDRLMITVTDPLGNQTTFQRSQYVDEATGQTAVGSGGGTVEGPGGVELRIPEGALAQGIRFKIEGFGPERFAELFPNNEHEAALPGVRISNGLKIESPDAPTLRKEVDVTFPLPDFTQAPAGERPENPEDAFYYVMARVVRPDGTIAFRVIDQAFVEGEGAEAKVTTASFPFPGMVGPLGGTVMMLMMAWSHVSGFPGRSPAGTITGKVLRPVFTSTSSTPTYVGVPAVEVSGVDAQGDALPFVVTDGDGNYTLWDTSYAGGTVELTARLGAEVQTATAYQIAAPGPTDTLRSLRFYRAVAQANFTFEAQTPPPPAPLIDIKAWKVVGGRRVDTRGLVVSGEPLVITFAGDNADVRGATLNGDEYGVSPDPEGGPQTRILNPAFTPGQPGTVTIVARAIRVPGNEPVSASYTLRVIAPGGSNNDPLPNDPPAVVTGQTLPRNNALGVAPAAFVQVVFTEPVRNVPGNVELREGSATGPLVPVSLSGVGPGGPIDPVSQAGDEVTSLTIQPEAGLKYGTRYVLVLAPEIRDLDVVPPGGKALERYETAFTTFGPEGIPGANPGGASPGIVVLGDRAYLAEHFISGFVWNGFVTAWDVSDPAAPLAVTTAMRHVTNRPVDIAGQEEAGELGVSRMLVVATASSHKARPSNLWLFDVSTDSVPDKDPLGLMSVTNSGFDGYISRLAVKAPFAYTTTARRGPIRGTIDVIDLRVARDMTPSRLEDPAGYFADQRAVNTDGEGANQQALVQSVTITPGPSPQIGPLFFDLEVADFTFEGRQAVVAVATGNLPLVVAEPHVGALLARVPVQIVEDGQVVAEMTYGGGLGLATIDDQRYAAVGGSGRVPGGTGNQMVLAVVNLDNPRTPVTTGIVALPTEPSEYIQDVLVKDTTALVGTTQRVHLVNLANPAEPVFAGTITGVGGRLALGAGDLLFSSGHSWVGGTGSLTGIHAATLGSIALVQLSGPNPFGLDSQNRSKTDLDARFSVVPAGTEVVTAAVDLLRDGTRIEDIPVTAVGDHWESRIARGKVFNPDQTYGLQFVVNRGTPEEKRSAVKQLRPALLEFVDTQETTDDRLLDLVKLFNPTPKVSFRALGNPGPGRRVTATAVGDVSSTLGPIAKVALDGRLVDVTQTSSGTDGTGPFLGTFQTQVPLGPQVSQVTVHAMNALGNLASDSMVVVPLRDEAGAITGRQATDRPDLSAQDLDPAEYAFRIELKDRGQRGEQVRVGVETGVETKEVTLRRSGTRFRSDPLYLVPDGGELPATTPEALRKRILRGRLGQRLKILYAENVREEAAPVGALVVEGGARLPIDSIIPSDAAATRQVLGLMVGMSGAAGNAVTVTLSSLKGDLLPADPVLGNPTEQSVTLQQQASDPEAPGYDLYLSTESVLPVYPTEAVDRPGLREHGVVAGGFLRLSGPSGQSLEPVGVPAETVQWVVESVIPIFEGGTPPGGPAPTPRFFDVVVSTLVKGGEAAVPGLPVALVLDLLGDIPGEVSSMVPVVPVGESFEETSYPARTGPDGKAYTRVRIEVAREVALSAAQKLKGMAVRPLDPAGGTVAQLLRTLVAGTQPPPGIVNALVRSGLAPVTTPFAGGQTAAGMPQGLEVVVGRIVREIYAPVVRVHPSYAAVKEALRTAFAVAGRNLSEEQQDEFTIALMAGEGVGAPLGFGHALVDDLNIITNTVDMAVLLYYGVLASQELRQVKWRLVGLTIEFIMNDAFRQQVRDRLDRLAPVLVKAAEMAANPEIIQFFGSQVMRSFYDNYDSAIGGYTTWIGYLPNSDEQRIFIMGFMLGHIAGYITEIATTLVVGTLAGGIAGVALTATKLNRVAKVRKALAVLGRLNVLSYREANAMQKVAKILLDWFKLLGNLDDPRLLRILDDAALVGRETKLLTMVERYGLDLETAGPGGERLVRRLDAVAEALQGTEETAETAIALGRLAEKTMQTPQGPRPLVLGATCTFGAAALGIAAAPSSAVGSCLDEIGAAIRGLDNLIARTKPGDSQLRLLARTIEAAGDEAAVGRALGKLQGQDAFDDVASMLSHFMRSVRGPAWDAATFGQLERLITRYTTTQPPPAATEAVVDVLSMLAKYSRAAGDQGPEATARIVKQLDRFRDAVNPVRDEQLGNTLSHLLALDKAYAGSGAFEGLSRVDLHFLARQLDLGRLSMNETEILSSFTRVTALKDEVDIVDPVTGPNSTLFRAFQRYVDGGGGPIPFFLGIKVKGSLGNLDVALDLRPHGRTDTDVVTAVVDPLTGFRKWIDAIVQVEQAKTVQVWGLQNGQAVLETVVLQPGQRVPFEVKAYSLSTWGNPNRVDDAASEVRAGLREVDPAGVGAQPSILAVTSDLATDSNLLQQVLQAVDAGLPLEARGRAKIWVLPKSAAQLAQEAEGLIMRLTQ